MPSLLPSVPFRHGYARTPFQGRFRAHGRLLLLFLGLNALVRLGLTVFNQDLTLLAPWRLLPAMLIGAGFDLCVGLAALVPLVWLMAIWPRQRLLGERGLRLACGVVLAPLCLLATFVALSEFTFWQEFASRFNFIAVEYLIYTKEVIGNIRESYNMPVLLGGVALTAIGLWLLAWRWALAPLADAPSASLPHRHWRAGLWLGLAAPALLLAACDARLKEFSADSQLNELAGNGYFDFWHAFRHNQLDYERFYRTLPQTEAARRVAARYQPRETADRRPPDGAQDNPGESGATQRKLPFSREVAGAASPLPLNVVLVSIESFSASFMGTFGNPHGLTPNLDRLAREGLLFTRVYATGTRTVRGLEALTLSVPPTPGHSIVKRPENAGLFSLGSVLAERGYEPIYLYGGYGYFDNMNAFFGGNGYTVVDRTALRPEQIHFENIWGVADEDLFDLTLRELDARHAAGRRFFAHVMTTSNHRPFTYPPGRIDIPSHSGREGGVKYTDYAIGRFIAQARARPWFDNTVFVLVADHTHQGRGKQDLPLQAYHIPLIVLAPGYIAPGRVETIASQIDVGPTLLGMLGIGYRSRFFGQDILREGQHRPRAFMANQQTLGYYRDDRMVELRPNRRHRVIDTRTGEPVDDAQATELTEEAISLYQVAARAYRAGDLSASPRPGR
jgi:phosphoglycerol transferase MdoB-like AlkP superfamily enzyme